MALARDMHTTTVFDLAADLKLPLGVIPDRSCGLPVEIAERIASETTAVGAMLERLHEAETDILAWPLARILSPADLTPAPAAEGAGPEFRTIDRLG